MHNICGETNEPVFDKIVASGHVNGRITITWLGCMGDPRQNEPSNNKCNYLLSTILAANVEASCHQIGPVAGEIRNALD
jgi:hypothetical protein